MGGGICNTPDFFITLFHSYLRLLFIPIFAFCLLISCEKEGSFFPEMDSFYTESCGLPNVTTDSAKNFTKKFAGFVKINPESKEHPKYPLIVENIKKCNFSIVIDVDSVWEGEYYIEF